LIAAAALLLVATLITAALAYQQIGAAGDRKRHPPRGRMIPAGGRRFHVLEQGSGEPTVVLEAGLAASSLSWAHVQRLIAEFSGTMSYDRAGLGWSDGGPASTLAGMAEDLGAVLEGVDFRPPYILVGHSFGGLVVRAFAHRFPDRVAGVVLVEPVSIRYWADCSEADRRRVARGVLLSRRGARLASYGVVRFAIAAASLPSKRITQTIARASAGKATPMLGRLAGEIQKLPSELIPSVRAQWCLPKAFLAMADHLACLPEAARAAAAMPIAAAIPVIVLSAASATSAELEEREAWVACHRGAEHIKVPGTGHWLHLERAEVVAAAVRRLKDGYHPASVRHGVGDVVDADTKA
jgi:pimeloyl-ACP methyl ester carboxylesterase